MKKVALIGHCGPDIAYLRLAITQALGKQNVAIASIDDEAGLQAALDAGVDLLLLNRRLDYGFGESEGVALIYRVREKRPNQKMMLVSNYPDAQAAAVEAGALPGFGKRELNTARVAELLREAVGMGAAAAGAGV